MRQLSQARTDAKPNTPTTKHVSTSAPILALTQSLGILLTELNCPEPVHRFIPLHAPLPSLRRSTLNASRDRNSTASSITHTSPWSSSRVRITSQVFYNAPLTNSSLDYVTLLPRLLPPSIASPLLTLVTTLFGITRTLQTHLQPLFTRLVTEPDAASILVVVAALFISFKILDMMYRAVLFWVNLVFRLVLWAGVGLIGLWVYNRGVDGFVQDVQDLAARWAGEYEKYSGEVKKYQQDQEAQIRLQAKQQGGRGWR